MQSLLICSGCRSMLLYPRGATNVCCGLCNTTTSAPPSVPPPVSEMAQLICTGCRTLLMYTRGASSVRCSCCHTVNRQPPVTPDDKMLALEWPFGSQSSLRIIEHRITRSLS